MISKAKIWRSIEKRRNNYERKFSLYIRKVLNQQIKDLVERIDVTNYSGDFEIDPAPMEKAFKNLYLTVGVDFAREIFVGLKSDSNILLYKDETDKWYQGLLSYVRSKLGNKIRSINKYTIDLAKRIIRDTIERTLAEGLGADQTARQIRKELVKKGVELNQWRALRIARTEVMAASNVGAMEGASSAGANEKYWIATADERVRDTHLAVESQNPKAYNEPFIVGGEPMDFPGDSKASAGNVINCRCTVAFGIKGF